MNYLSSGETKFACKQDAGSLVVAVAIFAENKSSRLFEKSSSSSGKENGAQKPTSQIAMMVWV